MLCDECSKRALCKTLCPEAELYVNQDEVKQREIPIGFPTYSPPWPRFVKRKDPIGFTKKEKEILTLYAMGLSRKEISQILKINRNTLRVHIANLYRKFNDSGRF